MNQPSIMRLLRRQAIPRTARIGDLAVVNSIECFTLASGHRMRAATCLLCHLAVGSQRVAIIGLAGLDGEACQCGAVPSDLWIIHASHFPVDPDEITAALRAGMACTADHPAHL